MDAIKENIDDLMKKKESLNSLYRQGKISPRYNQHLRILIENFDYVMNFLQQVYEEKSPILHEEDRKKIIDRMTIPLLLVYDLFSDKILKEMHENDKALESVAMDFFRINALPGIETMVIIEDGDFARNEFIPVYYRDGTKKQSKKTPIIVVNDKFVKCIQNWILIIHETSHLLNNFDECFETNNPRLNYECELFSDLYSTQIAGYAYVNALIQFAKNNNDDPFICTKSHPCLGFRVKITLDHLKRKFITDVGENSINELEMDWITWLENAGYRESLISDEYRAETSALEKLHDAIKELNVSNSYNEILNNIKIVGNNLYMQLTPIELLNYFILSKDFHKPMIDEKEVKNMIVEWSKKQYGR